MAAVNPTREGFAAVFRFPGLLVAEVAWRWLFGITAALLLGTAAMQLIASVTLTPSVELALKSNNTLLIAAALSQLLQQYTPTLGKLAAILLPALSVAWIACHSWGRLAGLRQLIPGASVAKPWRALLALSVLRVALLWAGVIGYVAAALIASSAATAGGREEPHAGIFYLVFVFVIALVGTAWSAVSWVLMIAPLFVLAEGADALAACSRTVEVAQRERGRFAGITALFIVMKIGLFVLMFSTFFSIAPLTALAGTTPTVILILAFAAMYSLAANFLFVARLAAFAVLLEPSQFTSAPLLAAAGS